MPIFHLKPVLALLDDPAWASSPYKGEVWANAADEREARLLVGGRYQDSRTDVAGTGAGPRPWEEPRLVTAELLGETVEGLDIPAGVVVAGSQI